MKLEIPQEHDHLRVDRVVAQLVPTLSRSRIQKLIESGEVRINGDPARSNTKVHTGDVVELEPPLPEKVSIDPEAMPLDILFEDDHLLVLNKPKGVTVHPAGRLRTGTLVNGLLAHCTNLSGINGVLRPGIVHRLDRDTTGLMVVTKDDAAHRGLAEQFEARTVARRYRAILWGCPQPRTGRVEGDIGRHVKDRRRMTVREGGRHAATRYEVVRRYEALSEVILTLETGRTHQIRVHTEHIGHPVFGDPAYGGRSRQLKGISPMFRGEAGRLLKMTERQMLHAELLGFEHPVTGEKKWFEGELPEDMKMVLDELNRTPE